MKPYAVSRCTMRAASLCAPLDGAGASVFKTTGGGLLALAGLMSVLGGLDGGPACAEIEPTVIECDKPTFFLAFSPDGRRLASAAAMGVNVAVWDTRTGQNKWSRMLLGGSQYGTPLAFSPDGEALVMRDGIPTMFPPYCITLRQAETGALKVTLPYRNPMMIQLLHRMAFSPDGKTVAVVCLDGTIGLCGLQAGNQPTVLKGESRLVHRLLFTPDGATLISAGRPMTMAGGTGIARGRVRAGVAGGAAAGGGAPGGSAAVAGAAQPSTSIAVWDLKRGRRRHLLKTDKTLSTAALSPDGKTLASLSFTTDNHATAIVWDVPTGKLKAQHEIDTYPPPSQDIGFMAYRNVLVICGQVKSQLIIELWDWEANQVRQNVAQIDPDSKTSPIVLSPDAMTVAVAVSERIQLFDTQTGKHLETLRAVGNPPDKLPMAHIFEDTLTFSPDGMMLASAGVDRICVWDLGQLPPRPQPEPEPQPEAPPVYKRQAPPDPRLRQAPEPKPKPKPQVKPQPSPQPEPEPEPAASVTSKLRGRIKAHATQPYAELSPDGSVLATTDLLEIKLWDARTGKLKRAEKTIVASEWGECLQFSPDGETLASLERLGRTAGVKLRDVGTGKVKQVFRAGRQITCTAFSSGGKTLALASDDGSITFWDPETGDRLAALADPSRVVQRMLFAPQGDRLAAVTADAASFGFPLGRIPRRTLPLEPKAAQVRIQLWDTRYHQKRATLDGPDTSIHGLAFSPDGKTLASLGDQSVTLWDSETGDMKRTLERPFQSMAFSPGGKTLVLCSHNPFSVALWDPESGEVTETIGTDPNAAVPMFAARLSPQGRIAAAGCRSLQMLRPTEIKLWDTRTGRHLATLPPPSPGQALMAPGLSHALLFSADGRTLAALDTDGAIALWDLEISTSEVRSESPSEPKPSPKVQAKSEPASGFRTWTSADGRFTVEAEFVDLAGDTVTLRRKDGKQVEVPLEKLSQQDQRLVRNR